MMLNSLRLIQIATSLGGVETVIELPNDLDWRGKDDLPAEPADMGLVRLSVGLEDLGELAADLSQALRAAEAPAGQTVIAALRPSTNR